MGREVDARQARDGGGALPSVGDVVGGKYTIERLIAKGGMGAVFAARHTVTGKPVALKWLLSDLEHDSEASVRLIREAKTAARVSHSNVVDVYDVGEHRGSLFLVMEYLQGHTLSAHLAEHKQLPVHETLALLVPVMRGVAAAHREGVIHRDLKPSNIFLCVDPNTHEIVPRVLDFGISKVTEQLGDGDISTTRTGTLLGTPYYMSPEQLAGASTLDARADVYAIGVILYQTLSGSLPFRAQTVAGLAMQVATSEPPSLARLRPELPAQVVEVVARAMARDAAQRYGSVDELRVALEAAARSERRPSHAPLRSALPWLALGIMLVAGGWVFWTRLTASRFTSPNAATPLQPTAATPAATRHGAVVVTTQPLTATAPGPRAAEASAPKPSEPRHALDRPPPSAAASPTRASGPAPGPAPRTAQLAPHRSRPEERRRASTLTTAASSTNPPPPRVSVDQFY
jgi:serine/threonine-protein kinase